MPAASSSFAGLPDCLVDHAQRRAAVAADEARACRGRAARVALALHQQQAHQRLRAGEEDGAAAGAQRLSAELVVGARERGWSMGQALPWIAAGRVQSS